MFKVALKDLLARKRRLVTTGLAIILGIAFLTGTQLLSSALRDSIEDLIGDVYEGIDAVVRSPDSQETPFGQPIRDTVPTSLVDEVAAVDGVRVAAGYVESTGPQLIDDDGKVYGSAGFGPPTLVYNWIDDEQLRTGVLTEGRGPEADDEIALDFDSRRRARRRDRRHGDPRHHPVGQGDLHPRGHPRPGRGRHRVLGRPPDVLHHRHRDAAGRPARRVQLRRRRRGRRA